MIEVKVTCQRCRYTEAEDFESFNRIGIDFFTIRQLDISLDFSRTDIKTLCKRCYDQYKEIVVVCREQRKQLIKDFFDEKRDETEAAFYITEEDFEGI